MSLLAHATLAAPHLKAEKKNQAVDAQAEIKEAKRIQAANPGVSWTQALQRARRS